MASVDERIRVIRETNDLEIALRAIRDSNHEIRLAGYITLVEMRDKDAAPEIESAYLSEKDDKVRGAALIALGLCSDGGRMDLFVPVATDPESTDNMIAASYIAMCESGFEYMVEYAAESNESERHREIAAKVLEDIRSGRRERIEKIYGIAP
ncbi:TPA: HEAT repeat domain-containing protein [Candidatus Berkelbacteria bacterium]|uniref:HEAT repeat domain-containing protein n=1 Tax=Berkelbacteria bacterium GW2011_GWE1_39_12 TaxID=1618337 RepID=A0A0G4B6Y4_9BACT|nr:MAG: hypothetical protein UT28_C0001G0945 [Berkelbacteria bacterium GW2011_GWE1_39_12]HBO60191.1 HEAT repeat domain-containing protein [Candidatus Berkelbacteria bacterium]